MLGHFQRANIDHVMNRSFVKIDFTDDSFNIILYEFNIWQVLIGNGITWWRGNTTFFNDWALFCKKELKRSAFFTKITNKYMLLCILCIMWWWQFGWSKKWTPEFIIKFRCDMKIKSLHDELLSKVWVGSLITCWNTKSTLAIQRFKFFTLISCFIIRTSIFWPSIKIVNDYA